jgi:hypothetical protein
MIIEPNIPFDSFQVTEESGLFRVSRSFLTVNWGLFDLKAPKLVMNGVKSVSDGIKSDFDGIKSVFNKVKSLFNEVKFVSDLIKSVLDRVLFDSNKVKSGSDLIQFAFNLVKSISDLIKSVANKFKCAFNKIKSDADLIDKPIENGILSAEKVESQSREGAKKKSKKQFSKKWGAQPPRLQFDAPRVGCFAGQQAQRSEQINCFDRMPKSQRRGVIDGTRGACAPKNFNVLVLKNGIQRVVYTDKQAAVPPGSQDSSQTWRSLRLAVEG